MRKSLWWSELVAGGYKRRKIDLIRFWIDISQLLYSILCKASHLKTWNDAKVCMHRLQSHFMCYGPLKWSNKCNILQCPHKVHISISFSFKKRGICPFGKQTFLGNCVTNTHACLTTKNHDITSHNDVKTMGRRCISLFHFKQTMAFLCARTQTTRAHKIKLTPTFDFNLYSKLLNQLYRCFWLFYVVIIAKIIHIQLKNLEKVSNV